MLGSRSWTGVRVETRSLQQLGDVAGRAEAARGQRWGGGKARGCLCLWRYQLGGVMGKRRQDLASVTGWMGLFTGREDSEKQDLGILGASGGDIGRQGIDKYGVRTGRHRSSMIHFLLVF